MFSRFTKKKIKEQQTSTLSKITEKKMPEDKLSKMTEKPHTNYTIIEAVINPKQISQIPTEFLYCKPLQNNGDFITFGFYRNELFIRTKNKMMKTISSGSSKQFQSAKNISLPLPNKTNISSYSISANFDVIVMMDEYANGWYYYFAEEIPVLFFNHSSKCSSAVHLSPDATKGLIAIDNDFYYSFAIENNQKPTINVANKIQCLFLPQMIKSSFDGMRLVALFKDGIYFCEWNFHTLSYNTFKKTAITNVANNNSVRIALNWNATKLVMTIDKKYIYVFYWDIILQNYISCVSIANIPNLICHSICFSSFDDYLYLHTTNRVSKTNDICFSYCNEIVEKGKKKWSYSAIYKLQNTRDIIMQNLQLDWLMEKYFYYEPSKQTFFIGAFSDEEEQLCRTANCNILQNVNNNICFVFDKLNNCCCVFKDGVIVAKINDLLLPVFFKNNTLQLQPLFNVSNEKFYSTNEMPFDLHSMTNVSIANDNDVLNFANNNNVLNSAILNEENNFANNNDVLNFANNNDVLNSANNNDILNSANNNDILNFANNNNVLNSAILNEENNSANNNDVLKRENSSYVKQRITFYEKLQKQNTERKKPPIIKKELQTKPQNYFKNIININNHPQNEFQWKLVLI
jgi:Ca2+-binding RTX toxin-like protein